MIEFENDEYVLYSFKKKFLIAIFNGYSNTVTKNVYITLVDGSKIITHKNNIYKIDYYKNQDDYLSVIDVALDTCDEEWFNELRKKYIGGNLIDE